MSVHTSRSATGVASVGVLAAPSWRELLVAYYRLTKPRIIALLLFTTIAALLVAAHEHPLPGLALIRVVLGTLVGGALAAGGACALNCYIDRDIDMVMARTRRRPIPAGTLSPRQVLVFGLALSVLALVVLVSCTTVLAALLSLAGTVFYVLVYTVWLKRRTTQNIVWGGIAGAIPPLVGWAAVTGTVAAPSLLMLVLITYWTPAHFWSLGLMVRRDYNRVHIPMLPSRSTPQYSALQILIYTVVVQIPVLLLYRVGTMGLVYLAAALALGGGFLLQGYRLWRNPEDAARARAMFMYSNYYLAAIFAAMVVDGLLRF